MYLLYLDKTSLLFMTAIPNLLIIKSSYSFNQQIDQVPNEAFGWLLLYKTLMASQFIHVGKDMFRGTLGENYGHTLVNFNF